MLHAGLRQVFAPKLAGLQNLAGSLFGAPVACSIAFSSIAGVLGSPGQANYAAANAAADAWVAASQAQVSMQPIHQHPTLQTIPFTCDLASLARLLDISNIIPELPGIGSKLWAACGAGSRMDQSAVGSLVWRGHGRQQPSPAGTPPAPGQHQPFPFPHLLNPFMGTTSLCVLGSHIKA
jgi:hypothetical protein